MGVLHELLDVIVRSEWPALVLLAMLLFRARLGNMIDRISGFSAQGVSVTLGNQLPEISRTLEAEAGRGGGSPPGPVSPSVSTPRSVEARSLLQQHPTSYALTAWSVFDAVARAYLQRDDTKSVDPDRLARAGIDEIARAIGMSDAQVDAVGRMRGLRDLVAGTPGASLDAATAAQFAEVTDMLLRQFKSVAVEA